MTHQILPGYPHVAPSFHQLLNKVPVVVISVIRCPLCKCSLVRYVRCTALMPLQITRPLNEFRLMRYHVIEQIPIEIGMRCNAIGNHLQVRRPQHVIIIQVNDLVAFCHIYSCIANNSRPYLLFRYFIALHPFIWIFCHYLTRPVAAIGNDNQLPFMYLLQQYAVDGAPEFILPVRCSPFVCTQIGCHDDANHFQFVLCLVMSYPLRFACRSLMYFMLCRQLYPPL